MTTTIATPAWATTTEVKEEGTSEQWTEWSTQIAAIGPALRPAEKTRDTELVVTVRQWSSRECDIPAGTPVIEVSPVPDWGILLEVDDVPQLIAALVEALDRLSHHRENLIREAGEWIADHMPE